MFHEGCMHMLLKLAIRNVNRNMYRLRPVLIVLISGFFIILIANSVLFYINRSFAGGFKNSLTGDVSISARKMGKNTLLGSNALLVGEYQQPVSLPFSEELITYLNGNSGVRAYLGINTVPLLLESHASEEQKQALLAYYKTSERQGIKVARQPEVYYEKLHQVIGLDFSTLESVLPGLELVAGSLPPPGVPGCLVQESVYDAIRPWQDPMLTPLRFTANIDNRSFAIREMPIYGVFRLPVQDPALEALVLADHSSVRALAGMHVSASMADVVSEQDSALLQLDLDSMFEQGSSANAVTETIGSGIFELIPELFSEAEESSVVTEIVGPDKGPWHFILINLSDEYSQARLEKSLIAAGFDLKHDYIVRDWRGTIGGAAVLVFVLQLILNIGALFVVLGVLLMATNGIMLSIYERGNEFGAMRALGASKVLVSRLVFLETLFIVSGSAIFGLILGILGSAVLTSLQLSISNPYLIVLLGGTRIVGEISFGLIFWHIIAALILTLMACISPLKKVLGIQPSRAMI